MIWYLMDNPKLSKIALQLRTHLYIANGIGYLNGDKFLTLNKRDESIENMIGSLIKAFFGVLAFLAL